MKSGLQVQMDLLVNLHGNGRAICVAAEDGTMSVVTAVQE